MVYLLLIIIIILILLIYHNNTSHDKRHNFRYKALYDKDYYENLLETQRDEPFYVTATYNNNPNINNLFTTSIYGSNPRYFNGLKTTINDIKKYPGWKLRIYVHENVPENFKNDLISNSKLEIYIVHDNMIQSGNSAGAFWRFLPLSEPVNFISVDIDEGGLFYNHININKWLNSDKGFIRFLNPNPYPWSKTHLPAGAWGKKNYIEIPQNIITNYPIRYQFGADELFLHKVVSPIVQKEGIITVTGKLNGLIYKMLPENSTISTYNKNNNTII